MRRGTALSQYFSAPCLLDQGAATVPTRAWSARAHPWLSGFHPEQRRLSGALELCRALSERIAWVKNPGWRPRLRLSRRFQRQSQVRRRCSAARIFHRKMRVTLQRPKSLASARLTSHLPFPWNADGYAVRGSRTGKNVFRAAPGPGEDFRPFE